MFRKKELFEAHTPMIVVPFYVKMMHSWIYVLSYNKKSALFVFFLRIIIHPPLVVKPY